MRYVCVWFMIIAMAVSITGCVPIFLMAVGGVGMYAVSKDTIMGDSDTPYETLWDAAVNVCRIRGTIQKQDFNRGLIEVDAKPDRIWVNLSRLTAATTKIKVAARKHRLPNIEVAQQVFVKILEESRREGYPARDNYSAN